MNTKTILVLVLLLLSAVGCATSEAYDRADQAYAEATQASADSQAVKAARDACWNKLGEVQWTTDEYKEKGGPGGYVDVVVLRSNRDRLQALEGKCNALNQAVVDARQRVLDTREAANEAREHAKAVEAESDRNFRTGLLAVAAGMQAVGNGLTAASQVQSAPVYVAPRPLNCMSNRIGNFTFTNCN